MWEILVEINFNRKACWFLPNVATTSTVSEPKYLARHFRPTFRHLKMLSLQMFTFTLAIASVHIYICDFLGLSMFLPVDMSKVLQFWAATAGIYSMLLRSQHVWDCCLLWMHTSICPLGLNKSKKSLQPNSIVFKWVRETLLSLSVPRNSKSNVQF